MDDLDRRTTIIEAAERLLSRGGVEAVSMRNVAVEAGVSLRLVQYYGKSKNELLTAVLQAMSERSVQHWQQALDSASGTQDAPLRAFFDAALPHDASSLASSIDEPDPAAIAHAYEVMALSHGLGSLISTNAITVQQARAIASDYMDRYLAT